jgi:hypothetical protein
MKKIIFALLLLPNFLQAQHVSKVYYNVVDTIPNWFSEWRLEDLNIEIREIDYNIEVITNGDLESSYVLTDTIFSNPSYTKYRAFDWKGDYLDVSIGKDTDSGDYIIIQYEDMGWCLLFDKR